MSVSHTHHCSFEHHVQMKWRFAYNLRLSFFLAPIHLTCYNNAHIPMRQLHKYNVSYTCNLLTIAILAATYTHAQEFNCTQATIAVKDSYKLCSLSLPIATFPDIDAIVFTNTSRFCGNPACRSSLQLAQACQTNQCSEFNQIFPSAKDWVTQLCEITIEQQQMCLTMLKNFYKCTADEDDMCENCIAFQDDEALETYRSTCGLRTSVATFKALISSELLICQLRKTKDNNGNGELFQHFTGLIPCVI